MLGIDFFRSEKKAPNQKPRLVGQKPPLKLKEIWAIRVHLHVSRHCRDLALFNLAIDSKLRACDLVTLRVQDICQSGQVAARAIVMQQKTKRPVQFEITEQTRAAVSAWTAAPSRKLRALVEASYPATFFIVRVYAGFENRRCAMDFERRFSGWPMPAMAVNGSGSGLDGDMRTCGRPAGLVFFYTPNVPRAFREFRERQIDDYLLLADAVLFLGSAQGLTKSPLFPALYLDEQYRQEISRQMEIKTGKPLSDTWGRSAPTAPEPF